MMRGSVCFITIAAAVLGCSPNKNNPTQPHVEFKVTPELTTLFGSKDYLSEVQKAYTSSHFWYLRPTLHPGPVLYVGGRVGRLSDLVGSHDFYAWDNPAEGTFVPDIAIEFTGPQYWENTNSGRAAHSISLFFDRTRRLLEVRVEDKVMGRASYEPGATRLDSFLQEIGDQAVSQ
jgi:hypothetical protein